MLVIWSIDVIVLENYYEQDGDQIIFWEGTMKKIIMLVAIFLFISSNVYAMMTISSETVQEAQNYGKKNKDAAVNVMQKPWTIIEKNSAIKKGAPGKLVIYTPYLVMAMDAQNKEKVGELISLDDGMRLASKYESILVIGAIIDEPTKTAATDLMATIAQEGNIINAYHISLEGAETKEVVTEKTMTAAQAKLLSDAGKIVVDANLAAQQSAPVAQTKSISDEKTAKASLREIKEELEQKTKTENKKSGKAESKVVKQAEENKIVQVKVKENIWTLQYFIYFDLSLLDPDLPIQLKIADKNKVVHEFEFHLGNVD